jgi:glycine/D-amino acid oxidase-like deaminating enzyme
MQDEFRQRFYQTRALRKTEYIIIGQGLAGTFLAQALEKAGKSFVVIDEPGGVSAIASGIINPVTGRRIVETWMIDELLPFAAAAYKSLEAELAISCCRSTEILDFFPTAQMRLAFTDRIAAGSNYLELPEDENDWRESLHYDLGYGIIKPALLVDPGTLVAAYRLKLQQSGILLEEHFEEHELQVTNGVTYRDISAEKIIYCDGAAGSNSRYFKRLPFALNKGEALIVDIAGLPPGPILKKGISIVPWKDGLFWVGSSHEWKYETAAPTEIFKERTLAALQLFCRMPVKLVDHLSGLRPATLERRPFIGFHPANPEVGIFNGLGTKGCSLAPYFAEHFVQSIISGEPLMPLVDVARFRGILSRP